MERFLSLFESLTGKIDEIIQDQEHPAVAKGSKKAIQREGDLAIEDLPYWMGRFFCRGGTGMLAIHQGAHKKCVYFELGFPVYAASNNPHDRLLALLHREKKISRVERDEAERIISATGRKAGAVLLELGLVRKEELLPIIRHHYEFLILSSFHLAEARWTIDMGDVPPAEAKRLLRHPVELLCDGLQSWYPGEKIEKKVGDKDTVYALRRVNNLQEILAKLSIDAASESTVFLFDGVRTLGEIQRQGSLDLATINRLTFALLCLDVLVPRDIRDLAATNSEPLLGDPTVERERVENLFQSMKDADYYAILGVKPFAPEGEVRDAYLRHTQELAATFRILGGDEDMRQRREDIEEILEEAVRVLTSPILRQAYDQHLLPSQALPTS